MSTPARPDGADRPGAPSLAAALRGDGPRRRRRAPETPSLAVRLRPDRDVLVDTGFSLVLVVIALVGLRTGFLGPEWMLAAGAGLVLGLLVAYVASRLAWPAVLTLGVLAVVYFLFGGPFAVRGDLLGGILPSGRTLTDLAVWSVAGWKRWLTLLPPVDARGPVLALPFLAGLLGAALTLGVARRWRAVPVTAVVPVLLLAGSIWLGTREAAAVLVQGLGFAVVLIAWLVVRAQRSRAPMQNGAGHRARLVTGGGLVAVAVLLGLLLSPALPGTSTVAERDVVRASLVPPLDVSQFPSPLPGFRRYTEPNDAKLYDKPVLTVSGLPAGSTVRFATLDSYDGLVWGAADRTAEGAPFQQVGSRISQPSGGRSVTVRVSIPDGGYRSFWVPTVGAPTGLRFTGPRATALADQLWVNQGTDTAVDPAGLLPGDTYEMTAVLPDPAPTALPAELDVASGASPAVDVDFLDSRIDAWTSRVDGDAWAKLRAFAGQMRTEGTYTDGGSRTSFEKVYLPGHGISRISRFVASTKLAGNDEQYAATLALVAQRLGIPARVVMGATPPPDGTIRGKDVHAWVEVQRAGGSWFPLAASTFVPDRDKTPSEQQLKTEEQKVGAQVPPPAGISPPSLLQGPDQAQNATDVPKRKKNPFDVTAWPLWLQVLAALVLLAALAVGYVLLMRWLKARRRHRHASTGPVPARASWVWRDLLVEARSLGVTAPRRSTRREQAVVLDTALVHAADAAARRAVEAEESATDEPAGRWASLRALPDRLRPQGELEVVPTAEVAAGADALVFGPGDGDPERVVALEEVAARARASMRAGVPAWVRWRSDADPRPLLARPEGARRAPSAGRLRLPELRRRRSGASPA